MNRPPAVSILMVSYCSQVVDDAEEYFEVISSFIIKAAKSY